MTPVFDPLAKLKNPKLAKPKLTAGTSSPTDILAEEDPLARYTEAIRLLPNDEAKLKQRDKLPGFTTSPFPDWTPQDLKGLYDTSVQFDKEFFKQSNLQFQQEHPSAARGFGALESYLSKNMEGGNAFLSPAFRDASLQSGLEKGIGAFGTIPGKIQGSGFEASVAKNLGLDILSFQDANHRRAIESANLASVLFPHKQIGFGGETAVGILKENVENQNTYDFSKHAFGTGLDLFNWQVNAGNIQQATEQRNALARAEADRLNAGATTAASEKAAKAQKTAAIVGASAAILGAVAIAFSFCMLVPLTQILTHIGYA